MAASFCLRISISQSWFDLRRDGDRVVGVEQAIAQVVARAGTAFDLLLGGIFTRCCEWVRNAPSLLTAQGSMMRRSSATR